MAAERGVVLLALGAGAGIVLAAAGLLGGNRTRALPAGVVARVNGEPIAQETYERVIAGVTGDRRTAVDAAERRRILDRLIDEELLVQRAVALGLVRRDARVRKDLTAAMIDAVTADGAAAEPSPADLERVYQARPELSTRAVRLRVRRLWFRVARPEDDAPAAARAAEAARRLGAGEPFETVRGALGDAEVAEPPDTLLPPAKLLDYLGPTALRTVDTLAPGETSAPVRASGGYQIVELLERSAGGRAALGEVEPELVAELRRERGETALRRYLDELRGGAAIECADPRS